MSTKGTSVALGIAVLAVGAAAVAMASGADKIRWDDLLHPPLPIPPGFPDDPISRIRVKGKSSYQYDVLGWRKNSKGEDYFLAVVVRVADYRGAEEWIGYLRNDKGERRLYKSFAGDDQAYARMRADFGVA